MFLYCICILSDNATSPGAAVKNGRLRLVWASSTGAPLKVKWWTAAKDRHVVFVTQRTLVLTHLSSSLAFSVTLTGLITYATIRQIGFTSRRGLFQNAKPLTRTGSEQGQPLRRALTRPTIPRGGQTVTKLAAAWFGGLCRQVSLKLSIPRGRVSHHFVCLA